MSITLNDFNYANEEKKKKKNLPLYLVKIVYCWLCVGPYFDTLLGGGDLRKGI